MWSVFYLHIYSLCFTQCAVEITECSDINFHFHIDIHFSLFCFMLSNSRMCLCRRKANIVLLAWGEGKYKNGAQLRHICPDTALVIQSNKYRNWKTTIEKVLKLQWFYCVFQYYVVKYCVIIVDNDWVARVQIILVKLYLTMIIMFWGLFWPWFRSVC